MLAPVLQLSGMKASTAPTIGWIEAEVSIEPALSAWLTLEPSIASDDISVEAGLSARIALESDAE